MLREKIPANQVMTDMGLIRGISGHFPRDIPPKGDQLYSTKTVITVMNSTSI